MNDSVKEEPTPSSSTNKRKAEWFEIDDQRNTHVYVSGLPKTITEDEFIEMMKKYGIIAKNPALPKNPFKIKLYKDKDGNLKGDGLCCYIRIESVHLAISQLDGYMYDDKHTLHCERAKFELKGSYDPSKKHRSTIDKKKKNNHKKKIEKLLSWND